VGFAERRVNNGFAVALRAFPTNFYPTLIKNI